MQVEDDGSTSYPSSKIDGEGPVAFIDRSSVSSFFAILVLVNALFIGVDTQSRATQSEILTQGVILSVELAFFVLFVAELCMRAWADKCPDFFNSGWNLLDMGLIAVTAVDVLFEYILRGEENSTDDVTKLKAIRLLKVTRFVRVVRLLRVFRFKKLMRFLRGFIFLVYAILGAIRSVGWVVVMFTLITYLCGIVTTEFIGLANDSDDPLVDEWFGDLLKSMFTLFQVSSLSDWNVVARHVGRTHGPFWPWFFIIYVLATNTVLMNVVLAVLVENVRNLSSDVKDAKAGVGSEDVDSWMMTPRSLVSSDDGDDDEETAEVTKETAKSAPAPQAGAGVGTQQNTSERLALQTLSEIFDLVATYVGVEGVNQRKLVTQKSLEEALKRPEVQSKIAQACPALQNENASGVAEKVWSACPKRLDRDGLNRQEMAEACMVLSGELSMNHFVAISQALHRMEKHIDHELVHLNKHQRKMNRRFLKLRHRLRKVYHFDGAPRKMVEMVNEMKRKTIVGAPAIPGAGLDKAAPAALEDDVSDEISLSNASSNEGEGW